MSDSLPDPPATKQEKSLLLAGCAVLVMSIGLFWCVTKDVPFIDYQIPFVVRFSSIVVLCLILFSASGHLQMTQVKEVIRVIFPFKIVPRDEGD